MVDENEDCYGVIVIGGKGTLIASLQGSHRRVLHRMRVDLPNKHRKGGQSAPRFQRLRQEARQKYLRKVAEAIAQYFLPGKSNKYIGQGIKGLVLAGSADCKDDLVKLGLLDKRLSSIVVSSVVVQNGGERGLDQAIEQSMERLGCVQLIQEQKVLSKFMEEIDKDSGKYCFSVQDTFEALEMGAVKDLVVWDDLATIRYELRNSQTNQTMEVYSLADIPMGFEVVDETSLVGWLCDHYKDYGCNLELVSDRSAVGARFTNGFGGLGGLLRWSIEF